MRMLASEHAHIQTHTTGHTGWHTNTMGMHVCMCVRRCARVSECMCMNMCMYACACRCLPSLHPGNAKIFIAGDSSRTTLARAPTAATGPTPGRARACRGPQTQPGAIWHGCACAQRIELCHTNAYMQHTLTNTHTCDIQAYAHTHATAYTYATKRTIKNHTHTRHCHS